MRKEKEMLWISNLMNDSKFTRSVFRKGGDSKREFEKCANKSINDKEFNKWFKKIFNLGIISFSEYKDNIKGMPTKIYILNSDKMLKYLKEFEFYKKIKKIAVDDYLSFSLN